MKSADTLRSIRARYGRSTTHLRCIHPCLHRLLLFCFLKDYSCIHACSFPESWHRRACEPVNQPAGVTKLESTFAPEGQSIVIDVCEACLLVYAIINLINGQRGTCNYCQLHDTPTPNANDLSMHVQGEFASEFTNPKSKFLMSPNHHSLINNAIRSFRV